MGTGGNGKRFEWFFRILQVCGSIANIRTQWLRFEQLLARINVGRGCSFTCPDTDTRAGPGTDADDSIETCADTGALTGARADVSIETSTDASVQAGADARTCTETDTNAGAYPRACAETHTRARAETCACANTGTCA